MKPWLLNILACPIDKYHPIESRFFRWETSIETINKVSSEAGNPSELFMNDYQHLAKQLRDGTISPAAIRSIEDVTGSEGSAKLLSGAIKAIEKLERMLDKSEDVLIGEQLEDIDRLFRFFNLIELDVGLLICPKCGRWYPIGNSVESVPEMLPDELRKKESDLTWLKIWRELVPDKVLLDGKPFNLAGS